MADFLLTRWLRHGALALTASLALSGAAAAAPLVMTTKSFTEQHILSALTTQYLRKQGFEVEPKTNIATTIARNAMINKQVDMTGNIPVPR